MRHDAISHHVTVPVAPAAAFDLFAARLGEWWPISYTFFEAQFADAAIEPRTGGRWFERSADGESLPWGDVRVYLPGERMVLGFGIGPDRKPVTADAASEIEVRFVPAAGGQTRVEVEHRAFDRHGEGAATMRAGMDSPQGWPLILAEFRRYVRLAGGAAA
jgi:uncharacterized protein YndB with AHSA1/START domain